jgi:Uma2 family endonuclease
MTRVLASTADVPELAAAIERRRHLGLDLYDYMDGGTYVVAPAPTRRHAEAQAALLAILGPLAAARGHVAASPVNLGAEDEYRIPDAAVLVRAVADDVWLPAGTVATAVEVLSPDEAPMDKAAFYADHRVGELWIVDPHRRTVALWALAPDADPDPLAASATVGIGAAELARRLWPEP